MDPSTIANAIPVLWLLWIAYWIAAARGAKRAAWREPLLSALRHRVPLWIAILLFAAPRAVPRPLHAVIFTRTRFVELAAIAVVAAGLGFSIYARAVLGRNWSGAITRKEDHVLIRTGPYRILRHPIYTGLLVAFVGSTLALGEWRGVLALAFAIAAIALKLRGEEALMRRTFPEYAAYRASTWALVPFVY